MATHAKNTAKPLIRRSADAERSSTTRGVTVCMLMSGTDTGGAFVLLTISVPPFWDGCAPHWHAHTTELIYVVHGTLACTLDTVTTTVSPGAALLIPSGVVHTIWNPTAAPATYITWCVPADVVPMPPMDPQLIMITLSGTSDVLLTKA